VNDVLAQNTVPGNKSHWPRHRPGNNRKVVGGGKLGTSLEYIRHGRDSEKGIVREKELRGGWIKNTDENSYRVRRTADLTPKVKMRYPQVL